MERKVKVTGAKSLAAMVIALLLFLFSGSQVPILDPAADTYFKDSVTKAGVSYGICRVINGTVSIIQESSLELEPAGVGLSLAVGQAVDPINDMVERLSNVLVLAMASLGIQGLIHEVGQALLLQLLAGFFVVLSLLMWVDTTRGVRLQRLMVGVIALTVIARFCLPISSVINGFLQENYFQQKIEAASGQLTRSTANMEKLKELTLPKYDGLFNTIENSAIYLKRKTIDYKEAISVTIDNRDLIVTSLLELTFLYAGIFVIQVLLLPLLLFWLFSRVAGVLLFQGSAGGNA